MISLFVLIPVTLSADQECRPSVTYRNHTRRSESFE